MRKVLLFLFCAVPFITWAAPKVTITQETPWEVNGVACGTQAQCQQVVISAAQAHPGIAQSIMGPTWLAIASTSGGIALPCPDIGAMQYPEDQGSSGGPPVFNDPCHAKQ